MTESQFVDIGNWDEKRLGKARRALLALLVKDNVQLYCPDTTLLPEAQIRDMYLDLVEKTDVVVDNADQERIRKTYMTAALANIRALWAKLPGKLRDRVRRLARNDAVLALAVQSADSGTFEFNDEIRSIINESPINLSESDDMTVEMTDEISENGDVMGVDNRLAELEARQEDLETQAREERKLLFYLMKELAKYATDADATEAETILHKRSRDMMREMDSLYECVRSSKENVLKCRARVQHEDKKRPSRAVIDKARLDTQQLHGKLDQAAVALERLQRERDELLKGQKGFEESRKSRRASLQEAAAAEKTLREELIKAKKLVEQGKVCNCEELTQSLDEHKKLLRTANDALKQYKETESRQIDEIKKLKDDLHHYKNLYGDKDRADKKYRPRDDVEKIRDLKEEVERERKEKERLKEKYGSEDKYKDRKELERKLEDAENRIKRKEEKLLEQIREKEKRDFEIQRYRKMESEYNELRRKIADEERKRRDFETKYNNYRNKYENLKEYGQQRKRVDRDGRPYSRDLEYLQEQNQKQFAKITELQQKLLEKNAEVKEVKNTGSHECAYIKEQYELIKKKYDGLRSRYPVFAAALEVGDEGDLAALGLEPIERYRRPLPTGGDRLKADQLQLIQDLYTQMGGTGKLDPNIFKKGAIVTPFFVQKLQEVFGDKYPQVVGYFQARNIIPSNIPPYVAAPAPGPAPYMPATAATAQNVPTTTTMAPQKECTLYLTDANGTGIRHLLPAIANDRAWAFFYDPGMKRVVPKDVLRRDLVSAGDATAGICTNATKNVNQATIELPDMGSLGKAFVGNFDNNICTIFRVPLQTGRVLYLDPSNADCKTFREATYNGPLPVSTGSAAAATTTPASAEPGTGAIAAGPTSQTGNQITLTLPAPSTMPDAYKQSTGTAEELVNILRSANQSGISNDEEFAQGASDVANQIDELQQTIASILQNCK